MTEELSKWFVESKDANLFLISTVRSVVNGTWDIDIAVLLLFIPEELKRKYSLISALEGLEYDEDGIPISLSYVQELAERQLPELVAILKKEIN